MIYRAPLTDEQRGLAEGHFLLARWFARRAAYSSPRFSDEFESAAMMAITEAARTYNPALGLEFKALAITRIRGAIRDAKDELGLKGFKRCSRRRMPASVPTPLVDIFDHEDPSLARESSVELDEVESFEYRIRTLPPKQKQVCRLLYRDGLTTTEAAREIGIAPPTVCQRRNRAFAMLTGRAQRSRQ